MNELERAGRAAASVGEVAYERCPDYWNKVAQAALKAHEEWLAEQGLVVVPREVTKQMLEMGENGYRHNGLLEAWQQMVEASKVSDVFGQGWVR